MKTSKPITARIRALGQALAAFHAHHANGRFGVVYGSRYLRESSSATRTNEAPPAPPSPANAPEEETVRHQRQQRAAQRRRRRRFAFTTISQSAQRRTTATRCWCGRVRCRPDGLLRVNAAAPRHDMMHMLAYTFTTKVYVGAPD